MPAEKLPSRDALSPDRQQRRVIELMRRRAPGRSLASIEIRLQELERELKRLRHRARGGAA